ncbi:MAG: thioesterase family protein [Acidobacteriota bacterium]
MKTDFKFHHSYRVIFADTDLQGIVFNGNYMTYYDIAWTEYFRAMGYNYQSLLETTGVDTVLARTTIEFKAPARFDDMLEIYTRIARIGAKSLTFEFEIYQAGEDRLLSTATSIYVCVDPKTLASVVVPDAMRKMIAEFEGSALLSV